ncbi:sugar-binding protein [Hydrocoleum sp. CS-953]|uniref:AAA-like domain-containing protein n=1 Tax=Hydrocoleum sp. CS-953 TaxID=1671698 RepID=UPI000B9C1581|nr:AAA-like domain-containing protein [Hydrocoleum sp. CS-953]OZH51970.1 sugar-binding protein [Hydrocoleum sp. CS-953]
MYSYQVGGSLANNHPTYIKRKADIQLYRALKKGEFCYVLNSRQMGKSSLLVRTINQLKQEEFCCSSIDMTLIGGQNITPIQWYKGIVAELWRSYKLSKTIKLKSWWHDLGDISGLQGLNYCIELLLKEKFPQQNIVIFIDEIDSILSLDFAVDDFFALIRYYYNQRAIDPEYNRLTFAIFGVATPSDLIADKKRTPFNIGKSIEISGFKLAEIQPFLEGIKTYTDNPEAVLREILSWTNGQPFLTQKICYLIQITALSNPNKQIIITPGMEKYWVESLVKSQIIDNWEYQDEPEHLRTIRDRILRNEQRAGRLLGIYQQILENLQVSTDDTREEIELILSGIVIKNHDFLIVKNRIYQEVFNLEWVKKQLNKLRPYGENFHLWISSKQTDNSRLLRGKALKEAQKWSKGKSLSDLDYQFLNISEEIDRLEVQQTLEAARLKEVEAKLVVEQKNAKLQQLILGVVSCALVVATSTGIVALWQYRQARISEIRALAASSHGLLASHQQLDAMIAAIKAKRRMESLGAVDDKTTEQVETALTRAVYGINEFNRLIGHQATVLSVDISSDGKLIATASGDKTVKIWHSNSRLLKTIQHSATVYRVAFSSDNKFLVSGSLDGTVKLWSIDGKLLRNIQAHNSPVWGVAFSPNSEMIASGSGDRTVKLWRVDGTLLTTLTVDKQVVTSVAFDAQGEIVASAGVDGLVKLWSINGKLLKILKGHQAPVWNVAFCEKTNLLVSVSSDKTAKLWQVDGTLVRTFQGDDVIIGVDCNKNGEYIATSGNDNAIKIWHSDGTLLRTLREHNAVVRGVALSSDGLIAVSASDDGTVKLWRKNKNLLKPLYGHKDTVWDVATSSNGKLIASVGGRKLLLWQQDGKFLQKINDSDQVISSVAFAPDSQSIAMVSNNKVELWDIGDIKTAQAQPMRVLAGHQAIISAIAISPNGQTIASAGDDKTIKVWNIEGQLLHSFVAHNEKIWKLAFTPDSQTIVSASQDETVKLWKTDSTLLTSLHQGGGIWGVAINPQGNLIASASRDDTLKLWKLDGTLVKTINGQSRGLTRVAFSPDDQTIATGGVDNTVKLWNLDGELLQNLPGHEGSVVSVAFTADGKFLVSGSDDRAVILWDLEEIRTLKKLEYACNWVRDYLRINIEVSEEDRKLCG